MRLFIFRRTNDEESEASARGGLGDFMTETPPAAFSVFAADAFLGVLDIWLREGSPRVSSASSV
jgi:hypothetical protein